MLRSVTLSLISAIACAFSLPIFAQEHASDSPHLAKNATQPDAPAEMRAERDRLVLENQIREETLRKQLGEPTAELQRIRLECEVTRAKADRELTQQRVDLDKARLEMERISTAVSLETARLQTVSHHEFAALRAKKERIELEAELAQAEFARANNVYRTQEVAWNARLSELRAKVAEREKEIEAEAYADERPVYAKEPIEANGDLVISDRRIPLNGLITAETADFVCGRIDFYNNRNKEFPIFIVIDASPGGSVMAGYKILKSMLSSTAPVYVVVKSYAASMAAAICTLATRSFAYPNAIILHHQISSGTRGNLAAQRDGMKMLEEWWQRLAAPIAQKMGITIEEFSRQMFAHNSTGDWQEFADNAVKLKWVDQVVGRCRETAMLKSPDNAPSPAILFASNSAETTAPVNRPGAVLPRLSPLDCYYLFNPDGYYRTE